MEFPSKQLSFKFVTSFTDSFNHSYLNLFVLSMRKYANTSLFHRNIRYNGKSMYS